jgi:spermidine/putrescine transport system substrate-binding protein
MLGFGLLAPLRHQWLGNLDRLDRPFQSPSWDPQLRWSAPSAWADLWDERLRGRLTMLDDPGEVLGVCFKKLGCSLNSTNPAELGRAQREAVVHKRLLRAYLNAEVRDQLVAGDVLAAQLWATTAQQAIDASPDLAFAYPAEGFALYADNAVVLRESRRQGAGPPLHRLPVAPSGRRRHRDRHQDRYG